MYHCLKDETWKNEINLNELEESLSCLIICMLYGTTCQDFNAGLIVWCYCYRVSAGLVTINSRLFKADFTSQILLLLALSKQWRSAATSCCLPLSMTRLGAVVVWFGVLGFNASATARVISRR